MEKVDRFGMTSGIIKIIPPEEWKASLPPLDDLVKKIRVREPIKQDIMGSNGTYRQVNIVHGRSYNLPQWKALCDQSEHQPPARRGERRANADKPRAPRTRAAMSRNGNDEVFLPSSTAFSRGGRRGRGRGRGRGRRGRRGGDSTGGAVQRQELDDAEAEADRPITPVSPKSQDSVMPSIEAALNEHKEGRLEWGSSAQETSPKNDNSSAIGPGNVHQPRTREGKTQTTSARRKYSKRESSAVIDEKAFEDFDYEMDISDLTPERCQELERIYWKTLTYAQPLYGADLMGTLFDDRTEIWNLNKLPNLLDVLGTKVPGVNTAYLYLGMWKATFAWHLEDVDLYSINYLHFGAPKQWYSISQADARRFEAAMRSIWPTEAKACDQFLRHKGFLISPSHLLQHYNIRVNKCLSYPGEFVVTYPYGYHSGYNLGYNCAEAVNFALESWLPMGKIAKKCECAQAQDSVWVDVYEIERRLRGEETEFDTEEEEKECESGAEGDVPVKEDEGSLPTPPSYRLGIAKAGTSKLSRKRARVVVGKEKGGRVVKLTANKQTKRAKIKKIQSWSASSTEPPCCLCPNDITGVDILETNDGRKAHRTCALYIPETFIETLDDGREIVCNSNNLGKDRLMLKCLYCRSKKGACFQCTQRKCVRAYHATCAAAAGVLVEEGEVPVFGEDGTEYKEQAFEFTCRFHRTKRDKKLDGTALEACGRTRAAAAAVKKGDVIQMQYYRGDIFAGVVVANNSGDQTLMIDILPSGDRIEVEWKWLLLPDPADLHLPKASTTAIPMPSSRSAKDKINATKRPVQDMPKPGDVFAHDLSWAEFHTPGIAVSNNAQQRVDLFLTESCKLWHYIYHGSTDTKARFTENPAIPRHNPKSVFLDLVPRPSLPTAHAVTPVPLPALPSSAFAASKRSSNTFIKPKSPIEDNVAPASTLPSSTIPVSSPLVSTAITNTTSSNSDSIPVEILSTKATLAAAPSPTTPPVFNGGVARATPRAEKPYVYKPRIPVPPNSEDIFSHKSFSARRRHASGQHSDTRFDTKASSQESHFTVQRFEPALAHGFNPKHSFPFSTLTSRIVQPPGGNSPVLVPPAVTRATGTTTTSSQDVTKQESNDPNAWPVPKLCTTANSTDREVSDSVAVVNRLETEKSSQSQQLSPINDGILQQQFAYIISPDLQQKPSLHNATQKLAEGYRFYKENPSRYEISWLREGEGVNNHTSSTNIHMCPENIRDPTTYRTPYAPSHGFTNGYEGNFRAHLMATQSSLFGGKAHSDQGNAMSSIQKYASPQLDAEPQTPQTILSSTLSSNSRQRWGIMQPGSVPLHPAIRPQYHDVIVQNQPPSSLHSSPVSDPQEEITCHLQSNTSNVMPSQIELSPSSSQRSTPHQNHPNTARKIQAGVFFSLPRKRKADTIDNNSTHLLDSSVANENSNQSSKFARQKPANNFAQDYPLAQYQESTVREFPNVGPNSTALMESIMANLKKAGERARP